MEGGFRSFNALRLQLAHCTPSVGELIMAARRQHKIGPASPSVSQRRFSTAGSSTLTACGPKLLTSDISCPSSSRLAVQWWNWVWPLLCTAWPCLCGWGVYPLSFLGLVCGRRRFCRKSYISPNWDNKRKCWLMWPKLHLTCISFFWPVYIIPLIYVLLLICHFGHFRYLVSSACLIQNTDT